MSQETPKMLPRSEYSPNNRTIREHILIEITKALCSNMEVANFRLEPELIAGKANLITNELCKIIDTHENVPLG